MVSQEYQTNPCGGNDTSGNKANNGKDNHLFHAGAFNAVFHRLHTILLAVG